MVNVKRDLAVTPPRNFYMAIAIPADSQSGISPCKARLGGLPHPTCKRDQNKMRDSMKEQATPPRVVTSLPGVPHLHVNWP